MEIWCPLSVSPKALTQRTGVQTPFPGCLKSLLQPRSPDDGNPESWLPLHAGNRRTGSQPMHACQGQVGTGGSAQCRLSGGETLSTRHPQLPGVPLHNPAASLEKLCIRLQHVARRGSAALSDAIAGLILAARCSQRKKTHLALIPIRPLK